MKKLICAMFAVVLAASAMASATATLSFKTKNKGKQLWGYVEVTGLSNCPRPGFLMMEWTPPADATNFVPQTIQVGWKSCTEENGSTHTWSFRTVEMKVHGQTVRAKGVWKCRVLGAENKVLAEAEFTVE